MKQICKKIFAVHIALLGVDVGTYTLFKVNQELYIFGGRVREYQRRKGPWLKAKPI